MGKGKLQTVEDWKELWSKMSLPLEWLRSRARSPHETIRQAAREIMLEQCVFQDPTVFEMLDRMYEDHMRGFPRSPIVAEDTPDTIGFVVGKDRYSVPAQGYQFRKDEELGGVPITPDEARRLFVTPEGRQQLASMLSDVPAIETGSPNIETGSPDPSMIMPKPLPVLEPPKDPSQCQQEWCSSPGQDPHPCPYHADVNNDSETLCNCCDDCEQSCAWDI